MEDMTPEETMKTIVNALEARGYNVRAQLIAYLSSGDITYITRENHARELIATLDMNTVEDFVKHYNK